MYSGNSSLSVYAMLCYTLLLVTSIAPRHSSHALSLKSLDTSVHITAGEQRLETPFEEAEKILEASFEEAEKRLGAPFEETEKKSAFDDDRLVDKNSPQGRDREERLTADVIYDEKITEELSLKSGIFFSESVDDADDDELNESNPAIDAPHVTIVANERLVTESIDLQSLDNKTQENNETRQQEHLNYRPIIGKCSKYL